jgi:hypothetical protein
MKTTKKPDNRQKLRDFAGLCESGPPSPTVPVGGPCLQAADRNSGTLPGPKGFLYQRPHRISLWKPCKFIGFGDPHGPRPYKFIGFGDLHDLAVMTPAGPWAVPPPGTARARSPQLKSNYPGPLSKALHKGWVFRFFDPGLGGPGRPP